MSANPLKRWQKKITRIDDMLIVDCVAEPFAIVIGAAVGLFHIFWMVQGPDCIDSAWDRAKRGANLAPNTPGTGKPKHRRFQGHGFATGPAIGPPPKGWGPTLIPIGNAAQKVGLGLAIVDGFLDGVFYGSSMARRYSGCANPGTPYCQSRITGTVVTGFPEQTFILASWIVQSEHILEGDPGGVAIPPLIAPFVTVSCSLVQERGVFPSLPDAEFTWEIIWLPSNTPVRQNYGGLGYSASGNWLLLGKDILPGPGDSYLAIRVTKTAGVLVIGDGRLNVYAGQIDSGLSSFYCGDHKKKED